MALEPLECALPHVGEVHVGGVGFDDTRERGRGTDG